MKAGQGNIPREARDDITVCYVKEAVLAKMVFALYMEGSKKSRVSFNWEHLRDTAKYEISFSLNL